MPGGLDKGNKDGLIVLVQIEKIDARDRGAVFQLQLELERKVDVRGRQALSRFQPGQGKGFGLAVSIQLEIDLHGFFRAVVNIVASADQEGVIAVRQESDVFLQIERIVRNRGQQVAIDEIFRPLDSTGRG